MVYGQYCQLDSVDVLSFLLLNINGHGIIGSPLEKTYLGIRDFDRPLRWLAQLQRQS